MTPERLAQLQEAEKAAREMYLQDRLNVDMLDSMLMEVAADYAKEGDLHRAGAIVEGIRQVYLDEVLPKQVSADPDFGEVVYKLSRAFVDGGYVAMEPQFFFTGAMGRA